MALVAPHSIGAQRGGGTQAQLPEGPGKDVVQKRCVSCHALNSITGAAGYDAAGWKHVIDSMIVLPADEMTAATQYLTAHFPEKPGRRPTLVPGPFKVSFKEWMVPTLGQRSRDPLQMADGLIWWAGQYGSLVGRLNPKTGEMKEFELPPEVRPHSIAADRAGNIWYMGNANGTVGKLNPATGGITVYKMPDPAARDPHTPIFDQKGRLFFSLQGSNMVGRLIPETGDIKLITLPTADARPYGMKVNSQGLIWVCYNGSNKLASINPDTMEVREYPVPTPGTRIRRLALSSDDTVWCRLRSRIAWPPEPDDREVKMAVAERAAVSALCDCGRERCHLVQRIVPAARYAGSIRPENREVSELADSVRRRHHQAHDGVARWKPRVSPEQHQSDRTCNDRDRQLIDRR
jgi:streptogramin lyase